MAFSRFPLLRHLPLVRQNGFHQVLTHPYMVPVSCCCYRRRILHDCVLLFLTRRTLALQCCVNIHLRSFRSKSYSELSPTPDTGPPQSSRGCRLSRRARECESQRRTTSFFSLSKWLTLALSLSPSVRDHSVWLRSLCVFFRERAESFVHIHRSDLAGVPVKMLSAGDFRWTLRARLSHSFDFYYIHMYYICMYVGTVGTTG